MSNFFSKVFDHKKILFFVFLSILIFSCLLFTQQTVDAQDFTPEQMQQLIDAGIIDKSGNSIPDKGTPMSTLVPGMPLSQAQILPGQNQKGGVCAEDWPFPYMKAIPAGIVDIMVIIPNITAEFVVYLSSKAMVIGDWQITTGGKGAKLTAGAAKAFAEGWASTRDLANMLIVLGFVIIGIATALRFKEYEAKKALMPLIIVALLINFSGLICGLVIDGSNLTMKGLIEANGSASTDIGTNFLQKIGATATDALCKAIKNDNLMEYIAADAMYMLIYVAVALSFLFLALALIARYAVLGILFMLSPIAFACYAFPFPKAKDLFTKWWNAFLKWAFIGVGISFFLNIAGRVAEGTTQLQGVNGSSNAWDVFFYLLVVLAILVIGIFISIKSSGVVAAGMGLMGGAVLGAGKLAGGMLNKATGDRVPAFGKKIGGVYGRGLEKLGIRKVGATANANSKAVDEEAGMMAKEYTAAKAAAASGDKGAQGRIDAIHKLALKGRGAKQAAAMKVLADNKDLGDAFANRDAKGKVIPAGMAGAGTNLSDMARGLSYAEAQGGIGLREKAEKLDPRLAGYNKTSIAKQTPADIATHGSAENAAIASAYSKANVADIREFSTDTLKDHQFIRNTSANKISRAGMEMSTAKVDAMKTHIGTCITEEGLARGRGDKAKAQEWTDKWGELSVM